MLINCGALEYNFSSLRLNYAMSRARFLLNLTKFINVVCQLVPSWQQPFNTHSSVHFPGNSSDSKQSFNIYSLVSTENLWQEHNNTRKYWHSDEPNRDVNRDSCVMDNFGQYRCYGQYSWQKSLTEFVRVVSIINL